ncbi:MAG: PAS domain S-box protein [Bacteroidales bacterium]
MMDQKLQQIQVLYEIALSVGRSLSLHEMLKKALFAYLRKLNCTAALVYKVSPTLAGLNQALQVFTLPYTYNINERFAGLHELLPEKMTVGQLKDWEKDLPCLGKTDDDQYYHILSLGEYGLLVLIKGSEYIDRDLLHSLADINDKLGKACMACESNESLQESEKKYRDLAELLPEMVCETDLEGNFTFVNEYALHRFGYGKEELIKGFSFLRIFAPQEAQKVRDNFQRALAHDNLPPREYQVITKRGEIFPVLVYTSRLMVNKKASGIRGVMIDITERKRMEQELKFERDLFHNFMDYIPAEVYFKDRDGRFVEVNQMKADQHNLSKEELLGKTDFDFYPEKEAVTKLEDENFIMETEEQVRKEEEVNSTYGKRWVMTYKAPRYDQDMEVIGTVGLSLDISDRVLMERKLQRSEIRLREYTERLESALIGSNAGLWDWNIKTGNVFYSDRWYAMLGYPKTELKPGLETWEALIHPEDKPAVMRVLTMHLEGETEFYRSEHRLKTKAGQWKWILDTGKVTERNEKGEPVRAVGTHIDIDQLKQYELTLQQNLDQQELLSEIALQLNSLVDFQNRIDQVLNQIGNHTGVSRVYIFEDAEEGSVTNNTFEWCNKGVEAQIEELQGIPYEIIPSWKKFLFSEGRVYSGEHPGAAGGPASHSGTPGHQIHRCVPLVGERSVFRLPGL